MKEHYKKAGEGVQGKAVQCCLRLIQQAETILNP
jgi:hypothetical protein